MVGIRIFGRFPLDISNIELLLFLMPEIIGPALYVSSTAPPLEGHISYLRYLTNANVVGEKLHKTFRQPKETARKNSKLVSSHIKQALEFHAQSKAVPHTIRPVLQY